MSSAPRARTQITDPTGRQVAANVRRVRKARGWSTYDLSRALQEAGRPIAPSAVAKLERAERRVDVGDLTALASALRVAPATLLLPLTDSPTDSVEVTGVGTVGADVAWDWMDGQAPLRTSSPDDGTAVLEHALYARPPGRRTVQ